MRYASAIELVPIDASAGLSSGANRMRYTMGCAMPRKIHIGERTISSSCRWKINQVSWASFTAVLAFGTGWHGRRLVAPGGRQRIGRQGGRQRHGAGRCGGEPLQVGGGRAGAT